jgi:hypothetical protein
MDSFNRSSGGVWSAVIAIASSTPFFTLACFALAVVLLMSQPPEVPSQQATPVDSGAAPVENLTLLGESPK